MEKGRLKGKVIQIPGEHYEALTEVVHFVGQIKFADPDRSATQMTLLQTVTQTCERVRVLTDKLSKRRMPAVTNPHTIMSVTGLVEHAAAQQETLDFPLDPLPAADPVVAFQALLLIAASCVRYAGQLYDASIVEHARQQMIGRSLQCSSALTGVMDHCQGGCRHKPKEAAFTAGLIRQALAEMVLFEGACTAVAPPKTPVYQGPPCGGG